MSEETAQIYRRARRNGVSAVEAWDELGDLADEVDWDVERMLSDPDDAFSEPEVSQ